MLRKALREVAINLPNPNELKLTIPGKQGKRSKKKRAPPKRCHLIVLCLGQDGSQLAHSLFVRGRRSRHAGGAGRRGGASAEEAAGAKASRPAGQEKKVDELAAWRHR